MTKSDIIARTIAVMVLVIFIISYIVGQIERNEWLSFATGASTIACCLFIADHVYHLKYDEVKGECGRNGHH